jgi:hypothetical protein
MEERGFPFAEKTIAVDEECIRSEEEEIALWASAGRRQ